MNIYFIISHFYTYKGMYTKYERPRIHNDNTMLNDYCNTYCVNIN